MEENQKIDHLLEEMANEVISSEDRTFGKDSLMSLFEHHMEKIIFVEDSYNHHQGNGGFIPFLGKNYLVVLETDYSPEIPLYPKFSHIIIDKGIYTVWEVYTDIAAGTIIVIVNKKNVSTQI